MKKIGIIGAAGTGKTTLAMMLSKETDIPFLASKNITRKILEEDGYDYQYGMQIEKFLAVPRRQDKLITYFDEAYKEQKNLITDRTFVDLAAYAICERGQSDIFGTRDVLKKCQRLMKQYTHLFVCPWEDVPIKKNEKRTLNPYYQFMVYGTCLGVLQNWGLDYHILQSSYNEERISEILTLI